MKHETMFKLSAGLLALGLAVSAHAKTSSEDFNSLIEENNVTQKVLSTKLSTQLKTEKLKKRSKPDFIQVGEEVLGKGSAENVVATTTPPGKHADQKQVVETPAEKQQFHRLSQELKDIQE